MKKFQSGFTVIEVLVIVVILGLVGTVGWLVYDRQKNNQSPKASTSQTNKSEVKETPEVKSIITFEDEASFDSADKQKILSQVAEPLVLHHEKVLNIKLKEVVIKKSTNMVNSADARYVLSYVYEDNPDSNKFGFIFGYENQLGYWQPQLCDHGGCNEYPEALKNEFPDNYKAYVECNAASEAGDKDKANSLCMI